MPDSNVKIVLLRALNQFGLLIDAFVSKNFQNQEGTNNNQRNVANIRSQQFKKKHSAVVFQTYNCACDVVKAGKTNR